MICVEWWCFEAIILLAGRLPQPEVAIDIVGICVNVATTTFMFPFGLAGQLSHHACQRSAYISKLAPDSTQVAVTPYAVFLVPIACSPSVRQSSNVTWPVYRMHYATCCVPCTAVTSA